MAATTGHVWFPRRRRGSPPCLGFTLVELLVVLGILATLVAIVLPALGGVRTLASAVYCRYSLGQWSKALQLYAFNNNGYIPRRGQGVQATAIIDRPEDWFNALPREMGQRAYCDLVTQGQVPQPGQPSFWVCPAAEDPGGKYFFAYAMNMRLSTWLDGKPDLMETIDEPGTQVFLADGPGAYCSTLPSNQPYSLRAPHGRRANIAFVEGRVTAYADTSLGCGVGDPQRRDVRWLVPGSSWPGPK